ncbi:MAG: substrate-binding domain-containing protein [Armatimonadetes bacterium]|nr:substrate-binding domain-containing protein [Armatimonadota bacterium]
MAQKQPVTRSGRNTFKEISLALQEKITTGVIPAGQFLPTERELQDEYSVSRSTVRRALGHLIDAGWAHNVPSKGVVTGRSARKTTSRTVALIDDQTFVLRVMHVRLNELLHRRGFHLVHLGGRIHHSMEQALSYSLENDFAGAIVWAFDGFGDAKLINEVATQLPIVTLDHRIPNVPSDHVTFDYLKAASQAVGHVIQQGRRRVAIAGMMDMLDNTHQRFSGYLYALFANGLHPRSCDFVFTNTSGQTRQDMRLLESRFSSADRPDSIFVLQDEYVPEIVECLLGLGLSIPDDVAVITIGDDVDLAIDGQGMSGVALDWDRMCELAVDLLMQRIDDPIHPPATSIAPHQLVIRGLCGAPPATWTSKPGEITSFRGDLPYQRAQYRFQSGWAPSLTRSLNATQ